MKNYMCRALVPLLLAITPLAASSAELGQSPFEPEIKGAAVVRALSVANDDFLGRLPKVEKADSEIDRFVSDPNSYKISVNYEDGNYVVDYEINPYKGSRFRGGGYRYVVDGGSYRIIKTVVSP